MGTLRIAFSLDRLMANLLLLPAGARASGRRQQFGETAAGGFPSLDKLGKEERNGPEGLCSAVHPGISHERQRAVGCQAGAAPEFRQAGRTQAGDTIGRKARKSGQADEGRKGAAGRGPACHTAGAAAAAPQAGLL
jgi:hypothetical protein